MFDFNAIVSATRPLCRMSSPVIVSENHNIGDINWVNGMSDPGEMIACGYLPELRRMAGEQDAEYAVRINPIIEAMPAEDREKIKSAGHKAAISRASLDTSNGRVNVMVAGEPAWHRLGVNVAEAVHARDAIKLAGLDWSVEKRAMHYRRADGTYAVSKDTFAIVRADTESQLGTVGSRYKAIQNAEGFEFLDTVIGKHGAKYHTAGSVFGGKKIWMQCELPQQSFEVVKGDRVDCYALFSNPHDGSGKAWCYPTSNRVVCQNTLRVASKDQHKGIGIRHSGDVKSSIADAQTALGLAVESFTEFREAADVMVHTPVNAPEFFSDLLDAVLDVTAADVMHGADVLAAAIGKTDATREFERKRIQREIDQRANILEDILTRYESEKCGVGGIRGTKWAALNAVTEHTNWTNPRRQVGSNEDRLSRRFESVLNGDADRINQTAYELLTAKA